jgi:uncharacterized protein YaaR (DUF327 family)
MSSQNEKIEQFRAQVRTELENKTSQELSYILGRFCGPGNILLSEKHFGYIIPKDIVEELFLQKLLEENILGSES